MAMAFLTELEKGKKKKIFHNLVISFMETMLKKSVLRINRMEDKMLPAGWKLSEEKKIASLFSETRGQDAARRLEIL